MLSQVLLRVIEVGVVGLARHEMENLRMQVRHEMENLRMRVVGKIEKRHAGHKLIEILLKKVEKFVPLI